MADGRIIEVITRAMEEGGRPLREFYGVAAPSNQLAVQTLVEHLGDKVDDQHIVVASVFPEATMKQARLNPGDVLYLFALA